MATTKPTPTRKMKYSKPYLSKHLNVNTDGAIRLTRFYVPKVLYSLFTLDVILFYISNEELAEQANAKANKILDDEKERIEKLLAGAKGKIDDLQLSSDIEYSRPFEKTYKVQTPLAAKFLNIIQMVDQFNTSLDALWLNGELESSQRVKRTKRVNASLLKLSGTLYNIGMNAMEVAQKQGHEKAVQETIKESNIEVPVKKTLTESDLEADIEEPVQKDNNETKTTEVA